MVFQAETQAKVFPIESGTWQLNLRPSLEVLLDLDLRPRVQVWRVDPLEELGWFQETNQENFYPSEQELSYLPFFLYQYRAYRLQWHQLKWHIGYNGISLSCDCKHLHSNHHSGMIFLSCIATKQMGTPLPHSANIGLCDTSLTVALELCPNTVRVTNRLCTGWLFQLFQRFC